MHNGLAHLCWRKIGQQRVLIFGWLEQLPPAYPRLPGHPYRPGGKLGGTGQLYVARFPISAEEAEKLFASAARGNLLLPAYPEAPSPGDGALLTCGSFVEEPPLDGSATSLSLPFLPPVTGPVIVKALLAPDTSAHPTPPLTSKEAVWVRENMFIDLIEHSEYLGALLLVRHHSVVRSVDCRLHIEEEKETELVKVARWPATSIADHRVLAIQQSMLGTGRHIDVAAEELMQLDYGSPIRKTSLVLHHPDIGLAWWREPTGFLRTIVSTIDVVHETRRIVQSVATGGTPARYFDVPWRGPGEPATLAVVGDHPRPNDLSARVATAAARRRDMALAARLGLKWFDKPDEAQDAVRQIIGAARITLSIYDPWFGVSELHGFVRAVSGGDVSIEIITSAEHLNKAGGEALEAAADELASQGWMRPVLSVMPGKAALHDRFICVDGRVWLSGNSLGAIGERASMLIEIPNSHEIRAKLEALARVPLLDWLENKMRAAPDERS